ncbi:glutathione S-transferase [Rhodobacteraceae bacterium 2376]|uniref:Glutathione S-transferase n=1 Tax=Rhabdonatronobacter sediminivivens TaxID=2743469 RepID=A0A7Z0HZD1_9RHOB|nr:glutathione S-transferase [Rhabdonatronobacter sediminivivens]NYS25081.1 glutathione S-transferase [Rhabdonatronobacter sediminivivens]
MIRLWHVPQSRSFRVLWLLEEMGAAYQVIPCSFLDGSLRAAEHLARSPAGRVPAAEIDGQALFESGAILQLLVETRAPDLAPGPGDAERAAWLQWLHFAETIGAHLANLTQQHIVLREDWMRSPTVMRLEARRLAICLQAAAAQAGDGWLLERFSAADVAVGYGFVIGQRFVDLGDIPGAQAYLERIAARPAFQRALERDGPAQIYTRDFYSPPEG